MFPALLILFMTNKTPIHFRAAFVSLLLTIAGGLLQAQEAPKPISLDDPKGLKLGPGVPRVVDTNGNVTYIDMNFTTKAYRRAAAEIMVEEVNKVAQELQLPENLPVNLTNIIGVFVNPFGFGYAHKGGANFFL